MLLASSLFADARLDKLLNYIQHTYGEELSLNKDMQEQLVWAMDDSVVTPEMDTSNIQENVNREIPRALARLYSLKLFRQGNQKSYEQLVLPRWNQSRRWVMEAFNSYPGSSLLLMTRLTKCFR